MKRFLNLKVTGRDTVEISVMGILKYCHRKGIGTRLFLEAKAFAECEGYSFMQVGFKGMSTQAHPSLLL